MPGARIFLFYPLVVAAFPGVFLWAENSDSSITFSDFIMPFAAIMFMTTLLLVLLRLVIKDNVKVSLIVSILLAAFFSYGAIHDLMEGHRVFLAGEFIGRHRYLLTAVSVVVLAGVWVTLRFRRDLAPLGRAVALAALVLLLFNGGRIAIAATHNSATSIANGDFYNPGPSPLADTERLPDIYYLIFDTYANDNVLKTVHGFDNSRFVESLKDKGFFLPPEAHSNYPSTALSLHSSLRMRYLSPEDRVLQRIADNEVLNFVQSKGYVYIHQDSGMGFTRRNPYADVEFLADNPMQLLLTNYSLILLSSTPLPPVMETLGVDIYSPFSANSRMLFNDNMQFLQTIPDMPESTFTFNHNFPPHQPAIFDRDGNPPVQAGYQVDSNEWPSQRYIDEIIYLNKRIEQVVDDILERSPTEPVIIIQGDHGSKSGYHRVAFESTGILNAYYLPEYCRSSLYPTITPVNSFRVVFNGCLGADFDLLEDVSYQNPGEPIEVNREVRTPD